MSKFITEEQKHEIEELIPEHKGSLIAYGSDMYHSGFIKGAITGTISAVIGALVYVGVNMYKKK